MDNKDLPNGKISAVVKPRIYHQKKQKLEELVPLQTPFSVHIDVCSLCNFKCSFCFQADIFGKKDKKFPHGMMKMDLFKKTVEDLKAFPDRIKKIKICNHGEPTLHPELPEFIKYVREADIADTVEVFTNGSKLNPELNKRLVESGLQRINISLEGLSSERYLKVAAAKINWDEFVGNIKNLVSHLISKTYCV